MRPTVKTSLYKADYDLIVIAIPFIFCRFTGNNGTHTFQSSSLIHKMNSTRGWRRC